MPFSLHSTTVAALPLVNQFLSRHTSPLWMRVLTSTPPLPSLHS